MPYWLNQHLKASRQILPCPDSFPVRKCWLICWKHSAVPCCWCGLVCAHLSSPYTPTHTPTTARAQMAHSRASGRKQAVHHKTDFPLRERSIREQGVGNSIVDSMEPARKFNAAVATDRSLWASEIDVMLCETDTGGLWMFYLSCYWFNHTDCMAWLSRWIPIMAAWLAMLFSHDNYQPPSSMFFFLLLLLLPSPAAGLRAFLFHLISLWTCLHLIETIQSWVPHHNTCLTHRHLPHLLNDVKANFTATLYH